jgi:putative flippase GtrA
METENKELGYPKPKRPIYIEILLAGAVMMIVTLIVTLAMYFTAIKNPSEILSITYSKDKTISFDRNFLIASIVLGLVVNLLNPLGYYFLKPSGIKADIGKKGRWLILLGILSLFGYLAFIVLNILLSGWNINLVVTTILSTLLVSIYDYLIYKLYLEQRTYSNHLFWELFRFAIVGLVAAVFDFITCFVFQFVFFKGNEAGYVTILSTIAGFVIGVIINYLMSTYMVYKASKSSFSKSFMGVVVFLVLSAIGLGIGIGIQYFLYDFLYLTKNVSFFSYPIDFVIRTLIVMVYNYISRKVIIYR